MVTSIITIAWPFLAFAAAGDAVLPDSNQDSGIKQEIDALNSTVKEKEGHVQELDGMIKKYKSKIAEQEKAVATLQNQVALLENRIGEKQLGVARAKEQVTIANLQIQELGKKIVWQEGVIARREESLGEYIRQMEQADAVTLLDIILARSSLSEFFTRMEELKTIERELADATKSIKESKIELEKEKQDVEKQRADLQTRKQELEKEQQALERDRAAKTSLVSLTQSKEEEFQRIVYELRQEQQTVGDDIQNIRDQLKEKLNSLDDALARGDILLNWPCPVLRGISAHFHDRTYPFRKFFEHPGVDVPTGVGTPVRAAAGGYVAWNKRGTQYGNYLMIVHPGGIATVYAHLSRFVAKADTYVERGEIIGYSGGQPGQPGAGLSTGPHVHFEVRQNGIPVDPENYLPSAD